MVIVEIWVKDDNEAAKVRQRVDFMRRTGILSSSFDDWKRSDRIDVV